MSRNQEQQVVSEELLVKEMEQKFGIEFLTPSMFAMVLEDFLTHTDPSRHRSFNLAVMGFTGIGKTAIISRATRKANCYLLPLRLANIDEGRANGYAAPSPTEKGIIDLSMVAFDRSKIDEAKAQGKRLVIFFDEFNRAKKHIRDTVFNIIDERVWAGQKLPDDTVFIVAINPPSDQHSVHDVFKEEAALSGRFEVYGMTSDFSDFIEYIDSTKHMHPIVKDFLVNNPAFLYDYETMTSGKPNFAFPVAWENLAAYMTSLESKGMKPKHISMSPVAKYRIKGMLGPKIAPAFLNFVNEHSFAFKPVSILREYDKLKEKFPAIDPSDILTAAKALGDYLGKTKYDLKKEKGHARNLAAFMQDLPSEALAAFLFDLRKTLKDDSGMYLKKLNEDMFEIAEYRQLVQERMEEMKDALSTDF